MNYTNSIKGAQMEENFKIEKEYKIPYETFKEAYTAYQKKNVYPRSYIFAALFIVLAVIYIFAAVQNPSNKLAYILIFVCLALAAREWYNPRKIRRTLFETVKTEEIENEVYKICVSDEFVEISTLPRDDVENLEHENEAESENENEEENEYSDTADDLTPEASKIPINSELTVSEFEKFFLLHVKKKMFYIVPKDGFTEYELEIMRELNLRS